MDASQQMRLTLITNTEAPAQGPALLYLDAEIGLVGVLPRRFELAQLHSVLVDALRWADRAGTSSVELIDSTSEAIDAELLAGAATSAAGDCWARFAPPVRGCGFLRDELAVAV